MDLQTKLDIMDYDRIAYHDEVEYRNGLARLSGAVAATKPKEGEK